MLRRALAGILLAVAAFACRAEHPASAPDRAGVPPELRPAFALLDARLSPTDREALRATPRGALYRYHLGLGMALRNELGLWRDSAARAPWVRRGLTHPDDISGVIIEAYWLRLHGQPITLDSLVRAVPPPPVRFDTLSPTPGR